MSSDRPRTPERALILGSTAFSGIDSVTWQDQEIPNIPDYDLVIVSVPHITEYFLRVVKGEYLGGLREAFVRFLHSGGKLLVLVSPTLVVQRPSKYPERVSNTDWCPVTYATRQEAGRSIVTRQDAHAGYLGKMSEWSFYLAIPQGCLTRELTDFYGDTHKTRYGISLEPYLTNRYERVLAGHFNVEIRRQRERSNEFGNTWSEYPDDPDVVTGTVALLPLIDKFSPEEALTQIVQEELALSLESPEPDWAKSIELPGVPELLRQAQYIESKISRDKLLVSDLEREIADKRMFRRLLFGTGRELETIFKKNLETLGATVLPSKYAQEEYILVFEGQESLVEVKGVAKSIALSHIRQLSDYLIRYQEDTGKECKGILFGNPWRNTPLDMRGFEDTPEFPDNVIKRAEQLGIALVSSAAFFMAFVKALERPELSKEVLVRMTTSTGVVSF